MRILFSILLNASILFALKYLLNTDLEVGITVNGEPEVYIIGGIILGIINVTIRPILKILAIPLFFVFLGLVAFIINGLILWLLEYIINDVLIINSVVYSINGWVNFIIAVAIFTIMNMFYSLLFNKK